MEFLPSAFEALKQYKQFIIYALVKEGKKLQKYPVDYRTGKVKVNAHDAQYWTDSETAILTASMLGEGHGVGFVFTKDDPFFFLDIDKCKTEKGWSDIANELLREFEGAAVEVSSSGRGLHILGTYEGEELEHACKHTELGIELYTSGRFVALTGTDANGNIASVMNIALHRAIKKYFAPRVFTNASPGAEWTNTGCAGWYCTDSDEKLLARALASTAIAKAFNPEGKASFRDLWEANTEVLSIAYPPQKDGAEWDESSADFALASHLAWWTGSNCERVYTIMQESALKRDKWEREKYIRDTVSLACKTQKSWLKDVKEEKEAESAVEGVISPKSYPERTKKGKPLNTHGNMRYLLEDKGIQIKWNIMTRGREITIPGYNAFSDDKDNSTLNEVINIATLNNMPITRADEHLDSIAQLSAYHPMVECIRANPWDGVPRLDAFIRTLKTSNDDLSYWLIRRWLVSVVAAAHSVEGFAAQGCLVLQGEQYAGKTSWIKTLDPIKCQAVKEGAILDPTNKDCVWTLARHNIVELGELGSTFRKDMDKLKAHMTSDVDEIRLPYARKNSRLARRTIYAASVNETRFLIDDTGNRRWWTLDIESINLNHGIDMIQMWAEVCDLWRKGESTRLTMDEFNQLNGFNSNHEQLDPFIERLHEFFDWSQPNTLQLSATAVLEKIGYDRPTRRDTTRMGAILTNKVGKPHKTSLCNVYSLPPLKTI